MRPHGTRSRYTSGGCRCDLCKAAQTAYNREFRKRPRDPADLRHGDASTYRNYGCHCDLCKAANSARVRAWRAAS